MVKFVDEKYKDILNDIIKTYEEEYKKEFGETIKLQAGDLETIWAIILAARVYKEHQIINYVGNQNLIDEAENESLEILGKEFDVLRLEKSKATASQIFIFNQALPEAKYILKNTEIKTQDGSLSFYLKENVFCPKGSTETYGTVECEIEGEEGNNKIQGDISDCQNSPDWIKETYNINTSQGGADYESDENLRKRIKLAKYQYSTTGTDKSYEFHTRSATPQVQDVTVISQTPGTVNIYALS